MIHKKSKPKEGEPKKILLIAGTVHSKTDKDTHYISASQLIQLYRIDINKFLVEMTTREEYNRSERIKDAWKDFIKLVPLYHGNYEEVAKEVGLR